MKVKQVVDKAKIALIPVSTAAMVAVPTMYSWASDVSGLSDASDLDLAAITTQAIGEMKGSMTTVIIAVTGVAVSITVITVGVAFLLKKLKGLKSQGS